MLGRRAVATRSSETDSVAHSAGEAATRTVTALPIASMLAGARSARPCDEGSINQPPPGGAQATRPSASVNALLPSAACKVSARARPGDQQEQPTRQQTR